MLPSTRQRVGSAILAIALLSSALWFVTTQEAGSTHRASASLANVPIQGSLEVGPDGHFRAGPETTRLFEHFALILNGQPPEALRERIAEHARGRLATAAADEAIDVLDRYLRMQQRVRELGSGELDLEKIRARFARVREIRREELGEAVANAMFGDRDRVIEVEIERRRVLADPSLAAEARARRLEELEQSLPAAERAARERATAPLRLRNEVERMRSAGASDADVFAFRERSVGKAAAERLAEVDRRRAQWQTHWESYKPERARVLASSRSLAPDARDARLEPVRRAHFSQDELPRARYLDRLELAEAE